MPNVISVFSPVSLDLRVIVQPFSGTCFPHFGHLVIDIHLLISDLFVRYIVYEHRIHGEMLNYQSINISYIYI